MTNRSGFIKNIARAGLFIVLAFIAMALGKRVAPAGYCQSCPENASCKGKTFCNRK